MMSLRFLFIIEGILFRCLSYMGLQRIFMLFHNLSSLFWEEQFRRDTSKHLSDVGLQFLQCVNFYADFGCDLRVVIDQLRQ